MAWPPAGHRRRRRGGLYAITKKVHKHAHNLAGVLGEQDRLCTFQHDQPPTRQIHRQ
jgi:hypothetical protein